MIRKLLTRIRAQGEATTGPEALDLVEQARAEHAEAERQLDAAQVAYRASLTADDDKAPIAARAELTRREVLVDRAAAAIELAERAHEAAAMRDAEAGRVHRYAEAEAKIAVAMQALEFYTEYARAIRSILVAVAEANVATSAANADLPEGAAALVPAEQQARGLPGEPERVVKRERKPDAWTPVTPGPAGQLGGPQWGHQGFASPKVELRPTGIEVTFIPAVPAFQPEPLATRIVLPDYAPGIDRFVWTPAGEPTYIGSVGGDGAVVLEAAAAREAAERQPPEDPRMRYDIEMTRMEPVPAGSPPMPPPDAERPSGRFVEHLRWQGPNLGSVG